MPELTCKECGQQLLDNEDEYCGSCLREEADANAADRAYEDWKDRQREDAWKEKHQGI